MYPQSEKLVAQRDMYDLLVDFLESLAPVYQIGRLMDDGMTVGLGEREREQVVLAFLEIDAQALEAERWSLLTSLRPPDGT